MADASTAVIMRDKLIDADLAGRTILQVIPELDAGGAERTTQEVAAAIVNAGGRSVVVSQGGRLVDQIESEGSEHITLPVASKNPIKMVQNARLLKKIIAAHGVDIVHARSRAPAWSALWAARGAGATFVTTYHGIYSAKTAPKRLYNSAMARGDRVIANSEFTAAAVRASYGGADFFDPDKMVVIHRGADLARFDPASITEERRDRAEKAFGGADSLKILLPGRLTSWKGQHLLIEAARLLQGEKSNIRPCIVLVGSAQGRDDYAQSLHERIEEHQLQQTVHLHDHWDDMPAAYDWADIVVSASTRPEAFGRVAVEAQAMGRPVVASAHGGALETVVDAETGFLFPPESAEGLATALARLAEMTENDRQEMGNTAQMRARQLFSSETMTRATLSVYMGITGDADGASLRAG